MLRNSVILVSTLTYNISADKNLDYDVNGIPRINSRELSLKIYKDGEEKDASLNVQFITTGQLLAHDTSREKAKNPGELYNYTTVQE